MTYFLKAFGGMGEKCVKIHVVLQNFSHNYIFFHLAVEVPDSTPNGKIYMCFSLMYAVLKYISPLRKYPYDEFFTPLAANSF